MKNKLSVGLLMLCLLPSCVYAGYYQAIAVDLTTGVTGSAQYYSRGSEAKAAALKMCRGNSNMENSCEVVATFNDACGAVAWSPSQKIATEGWHIRTVEKAKSKALARCEKKGATDCKTIESFCGGEAGDVSFGGHRFYDKYGKQLPGLTW